MSTVQKFTNVTNTRAKFRDSFANPAVAQPNPDNWVLTNPDGHLITQGGDSSGASYLRISLDPFKEDTEVSLTSKATFNTPARIGFGVSISQRILGQEIFAGMVGCNEFEQVEYLPAPAPQAISGTVSVTSNAATITIPNHGLKGGDRVTVYGNTTPQLNVDPVVATVLDGNIFTVPVTLANGTYAAGGYVILQDPLGGARNGVGFLWENTTATNASFVSRRNGAKFRSTNSTVASSTATQTNTNGYTDAFNATANNELYMAVDEVAWRSFATDGGGGMTGYGKYSQSVPDEDNEYKIHFRARILKGATRPIARVTSITKTASTTATVTTDVPHGLTATDYVQVIGVRDQTNFGAHTSPNAIASIVNATTFTVTIGISATATSAGGAVYICEGSVAAPGAVTGIASTGVARTNGVLTVTGTANWSGLASGEYVHLWGLTENGAQVYEGAYKVLRQSTTSLELAAPGPDFGFITTGGVVIKRTDVRLHWARVIDFQRLGVEVLGGKGNTNDANNAVPVTLAGATTVSVSQSTGSATGTSNWSAVGLGGLMAADVTSAAITSTATTSAITPGTLAGYGAYSNSFSVVVTAVSGTTPTLDIGVEESPDNGTNWVRIYDFPRITATGTYVSPLIPNVQGTRYRYVQTVGGTTPSFTRSINRSQVSATTNLQRQFIDRTVNPNTLNATTPMQNIDGCNSFQLAVTMGAITTTAPVFTLQGSDDGANWYPFGPNVTGVANSTAIGVAKDVALPKFIRAIVATAGVGATLTNVTIRGGEF